jgi:hypothetical protein
MSQAISADMAVELITHVHENRRSMPERHEMPEAEGQSAPTDIGG